MKLRITILLIALAIIIFGARLLTKEDKNRFIFNASSVITAASSTVTIDSKTFVVELARTESEKAKGLSGRDSLNPSNGMLFIFDPPTDLPFWMKDMRFPLDFVWIRDNQVIDITRNVPPPTTGVRSQDLPLYAPNSVVDHVLEINAGMANSFKIGDSVSIFTPNSSI